MDEHLERSYLAVELYEKILVRERRKKIIILTLTLVVFLFLCGIPVYNERFPKWESLRSAKNIAVAIEKLKTEALHLQVPLQLTVLDNGRIKVERVLNCNLALNESEKIEGLLHESSWKQLNNNVSLLSELDAKKLKLNWVVHQICFDPVSGVNLPKIKKVFVIVPVKDLAESRLDRASYVEVETSFARISIN